MLWLCLLLPRLPLDLMARAGHDAALPQAVVDGNGPRRWIVQANAAAQARGVRAAHSVAAARAYAPDLVIAPREPRAERAALARLAACCYRLSAAVSITSPDAVLLEAGASLTLFGGATAFLGEAHADCARLGLSAHAALAPTPAAAELIARATLGGSAETSETGVGDSAPVIADEGELNRILARVPLVHTPLADEIREGLARVGFTTVGDLARLPRTALARRFQAETVAYLDRLLGHDPDPRPRWLPPPRFASGIELPAHFHALEPLLFPLRRLVWELAAALAAREGGVQRFMLVLKHEDLPPTRVAIGAAEPTRDAARLFELARARLERTTLPAPVTTLRLVADSLPPFAPRAVDLFRQDAALPLPRLLERLRARLGESAIVALAEHADHRPERASRFEPELDLAEPRAGYATARTARVQHLGTRPTWLLAAPEPIDPARFRLMAGPERIETGWWDDADVTRDYYLASRADGAIGWIFHECRPPQRWYVHGWFG